MDRWTDRWTDRQIDGQIDRWTDRWTDKLINSWVHVNIVISHCVLFQPVLGDGFRSLPHNTSQQVESFLSSIIENRADTSIDTDIPISSLEYGQTSIKGSLFRKERLKWSRCFCLIRNSFLECHKNSSAAASSQKPILKLLLLGSQVLPNQVSRWYYLSCLVFDFMLKSIVI